MNNNIIRNSNDILYDSNNVLPSNVHDVIAKYMLADGFNFVLDLEKSKGTKIIDAKNGNEYLDFFTFFASSALGMNHPKLSTEAVNNEFINAAINKPSNSDIYTVQMAEFVETFARLAKPDYMKH